MKTLTPVRGTDDYAPKQAYMREQVRRQIMDCYLKNGFNLISTPILEHLSLLNSSDGGDNLRMMFKTIKRRDALDLSKPNLCESDIVEEGLRYDLTVPLARFYSNNKEKLPTPFKSIQIDYSFRAERPQKGRNRQFIQCDIDIFGDPSIYAELELLQTTIEAYETIGFNNLTLKINHRQILNVVVLSAGFSEKDISSVCTTLDKLDKIALTGVVDELKQKGYNEANINKFVEILNDISASGLDAVKKYGKLDDVIENLTFLINTLNTLTAGKHNIKFDISIVRGQGYYTGAVFEVYADGFNHAIGGGGRYDNMVNKISGVSTPAVGFGMGFEPVVMLLNERGKKKTNNQLALIYDKDDDILSVYKLKNELKKQFSVSLYLRPKNMKNFYEKISEVANYTATFKDYTAKKEIKTLN